MEENKEKTPEQIDYEKRVEEYIEGSKKLTEQTKITVVGRLQYDLDGIKAMVAFIDYNPEGEKKTVEDVLKGDEEDLSLPIAD